MTKTAAAIKKFGWLNSNVVATVLSVKALILIFGFQSYQIVTDKPLNDIYWFLGIWKHWDAEQYLAIAQNGYAASGENRFLLVFFPLYPWLIRVFSFIFRDYLLSAFVVSGIASVALGLLFRELVRLDYGEKIAQLSVLFLFVFPTGFFLHIPYTESLFLALAVGCFLAARKRCWIIVGILGALACLTRINGLILLPALAFEVWAEYRETEKFNRKWLYLVLPAVGFGAYLFLNFWVSGNPTMFLVYQREHWGKYLSFPLFGIKGIFNSTYGRSVSGSLMNGIQELFFVIIGIFTVVVGWRQLRNSYRVWMLLNWLLFVSTSFVQSVPRYTLVLFPLFILMALAAAKSRWTNTLLTVWSILYLSLFITQFVRGWWAF